jgi:hypothetical protein
MMVRWTRGIGVVLLGCTLAGCVADRQYRNGVPVLREQLHASAFDPTQTGNLAGKYSLAFIEFNDKGQMFEPAQLDRTLAEVHRARTARAGAKPMIVLFVHGWKNNASEDSGNVWGFRQVLAGLALNASLSAPTEEVVGIYVGWRGATITAPVLKEFTVFDRHHAARHVPVPVMSGALQRLMEAAKESAISPSPATMVMIGHSFGGAVLEIAVAPPLTRAVREARAAHAKTVTWPADLIVLLNEAHEGQEAKPLLDLMAAELKPWTCAKPSDAAAYSRPAIISISSTGDVATRGYFPGEQLIARPIQKKTYKGAGGARLYYETTAHNGRLRSHVFGRTDDPDIAAAMSTCLPTLVSTVSYGAKDIEYAVVPNPAAANKTPYWVMHMPPAIVPDHSTIFTQVFRDVLISLIGQALLNEQRAEVKPVVP